MMKKLRLFCTILLIIALLCGCAVSRASELPSSVDTSNQSATKLPPRGEPAPPKQSHEDHILELNYDTDMAYSQNNGISNGISKVFCIRSYAQYIQFFSEMAQDSYGYDAEFFRDHSIIYLLICLGSYPYQVELGELTHDSSGNYHLDLKYYSPELVCTAMGYSSIIIEVDHIVDANAYIDFSSSWEVLPDFRERFPNPTCH